MHLGSITIGRRKNWDVYVADAERLAATEGFRALRDEVLQQAAIGPDERVLDVGAGTGLLALEAAVTPARVTALDISAGMCERLRQIAADRGILLREVVQASADTLPFDDASFDVVVSNYCLHELDDDGKKRALNEIWRVLASGGRLSLGDMMFALGVATPRGRQVILLKVRAMLAKGPAGLWRLLRNAARVATGRWERPVSASWWEQALHDAGFVDARVRTLHHERGVAIARRL